MVARGTDGKFIKGQSGNPGGRPVAEFTLPGLIDETVSRKDWLEIFERVKLMAKRGDMKAVELLLDRRFGKAKESKELSGELKLVIDWDDHNTN